MEMGRSGIPLDSFCSIYHYTSFGNPDPDNENTKWNWDVHSYCEFGRSNWTGRGFGEVSLSRCGNARLN